MHRLNTFNELEQPLKCFLLFAQCIAVKGARQGVIYDLNRSTYQPVPNDIIGFIENFEGKTIKEIYGSFSEEDLRIVKEYINILEDKEFIFWVDQEDIQLFPKLNLDWDYPAQISNAIIDIDEHSKMPFEKVINELIDLGCKHLLIRSYCAQKIDYWEKILNFIKESPISSIEFYTKYDTAIQQKEIQQLFQNHLRLQTFVIHSSSDYNLIEIESEAEKKILFVKDDLLVNRTKNLNHPSYFNTSTSLFTEAHHHHSYFNRKVVIDENGEIKNCSSLSKSFGNINEISIAEVIQQEGFKSLWDVKKDNTLICKDCEFRYMCMDMREPLKNSEGMFYHQQACNYDPYTARWNFE